MVATDSEDFPYTSRGMFTPYTKKEKKKKGATRERTVERPMLKKGDFSPSREVKKSLLKFVELIIKLYINYRKIIEK